MEENKEYTPEELKKIDDFYYAGFKRQRDNQFLGMLFTLKDGSTVLVENKNSIDLEDKSNGELD